MAYWLAKRLAIRCRVSNQNLIWVSRVNGSISRIFRYNPNFTEYSTDHRYVLSIHRLVGYVHLNSIRYYCLNGGTFTSLRCCAWKVFPIRSLKKSIIILLENHEIRNRSRMKTSDLLKYLVTSFHALQIYRVTSLSSTACRIIDKSAPFSLR